MPGNNELKQANDKAAEQKRANELEEEKKKSVGNGPKDSKAPTESKESKKDSKDGAKNEAKNQPAPEENKKEPIQIKEVYAADLLNELANQPEIWSKNNSSTSSKEKPHTLKNAPEDKNEKKVEKGLEDKNENKVEKGPGLLARAFQRMTRSADTAKNPSQEMEMLEVKKPASVSQKPATLPNEVRDIEDEAGFTPNKR